MQEHNISTNFPFFDNIVTCYTGPIDIEVLSFFSDHLENLILADSIIYKKIHKIYIELAHNVSKYSAKRKETNKSRSAGVGTFILKEYDNCYKLSTENIIVESHGYKLMKNCSEINRLCKVELRKLKRETRNHSEGRDVGAHVGLIQIGILSGNLIECEIKEIDSKYSFFTITAKINKCYD